MKTLENEMACLKTDIAYLKSSRNALQKSINRLTFYILYLRFIQWFRSPAKSLNSWPLVVLAIGPLAIGVFSLVTINEVFYSWKLSLVGATVISLGCVLMFAHLLLRPPGKKLQLAIVDVDFELESQRVHLETANDRLRAATERLRYIQSEMRQMIDSGRLQRELLLQRNWKAMRDDEWEDFLADVFRALGADVKQTGRSGDQGVDLIVEFGQRRMAIQAKGYYHSVNGRAVQEAVAGVAHYQCDSSAVITNSRFTKAARELAASNGCILVGENEIADFVLGKLTIWS